MKIGKLIVREESGNLIELEIHFFADASLMKVAEENNSEFFERVDPHFSLLYGNSELPDAQGESILSAWKSSRIEAEIIRFERE